MQHAMFQDITKNTFKQPLKHPLTTHRRVLTPELDFMTPKTLKFDMSHAYIKKYCQNLEGVKIILPPQNVRDIEDTFKMYKKTIIIKGVKNVMR